MYRHLIVLFLLSMGIQAPLMAQSSTGHWQFVRMATGRTQVAPTAYSDIQTKGGEGDFTVVQQGNVNYQNCVTFGAEFLWSRPPVSLTPGAVIDWPMTAKVVQSSGNCAGLGNHFLATFYPYQATSNLATFMSFSSEKAGQIDMNNSSAAGARFAYNNATQAQPQKVPGSNMADANGQMTWLVEVDAHSTYYWSYIYQWTPGAASGGSSSTAGSGGSGAGVEDPVNNVTWAITANGVSSGNWIFRSNGDVVAIDPSGRQAWTGKWQKLGHYQYLYVFDYMGQRGIHQWVRFVDSRGSGRADQLIGYSDAAMRNENRQGTVTRSSGSSY